MRRLMIAALGIGFFCASPFLYSGFLYSDTAMSADKAPAVTKAAPAVRVTRMRAAGVVTEISDTTLKIERKVKDKVETMEFALEKPVAKIKAGDKVKVSYITKDDKNVAARVSADVSQKVVKKVKKPEEKAAKGGAGAGW